MQDMMAQTHMYMHWLKSDQAPHYSLTWCTHGAFNLQLIFMYCTSMEHWYWYTDTGILVLVLVLLQATLLMPLKGLTGSIMVLSDLTGSTKGCL